MGPTWGPPGDDRAQIGPMSATWTLLSGCIEAFQVNGNWQPVVVVGVLLLDDDGDDGAAAAAAAAAADDDDDDDDDYDNDAF